MPADARRARRRARGYRRAVLTTIAVLGVATASLAIAGAFRGPHLDEASIDAATALERPGQRLVLRADQGIGAVGADDLRVTPDVPVDVSSDGRAITIRFAGMLRALTEYTVSVDVTGAATGVDGTLEYTFTTPDLALAVLVRDPDGDDQVRTRTVFGDDAVALFEADRIQEFALTPDGVAAIVLDDSGSTGVLVIAPTGEVVTQEVAMPWPARLQQVRSSDTTGMLGVVATSTETGDPEAAIAQLLLLDRLEPSGVARPVRGLDGEPLSVLDWLFVPGTAYLVAQAYDGSLLLVDTADPEALPVPLGEHAELRGFLPGTLSLVVADPQSGSTIDLATGETTLLELPDDGLADTVYRGEVIALARDRYLEVAWQPAATGLRLDYQILRVGPEGAEVVYDPDAGVSLRDICLSPNGQYLAVEVQDPEGEPDGYPQVPGRSGTFTYFVDLDTGSANRAIPGFASSWCG